MGWYQREDGLIAVRISRKSCIMAKSQQSAQKIQYGVCRSAVCVGWSYFVIKSLSGDYLVNSNYENSIESIKPHVKILMPLCPVYVRQP
jgi:hypothetical protein